MLNVTITMTTAAPIHSGWFETVATVSPAPCSCGTRYSQPMMITNTVQILRNGAELNRSSAKSGRVYAPDRRSGAATNSSSARYPAVNPTGNHNASTPPLNTSPAIPRKDAADRNSPEIAAAFQRGPIVREATRKSEVDRVLDP